MISLSPLEISGTKGTQKVSIDVNNLKNSGYGILECQLQVTYIDGYQEVGVFKLSLAHSPTKCTTSLPAMEYLSTEIYYIVIDLPDDQPGGCAMNSELSPTVKYTDPQGNVVTVSASTDPEPSTPGYKLDFSRRSR